jgi:prevent-host-death family protein
MKTILISEFKAHCAAIINEVNKNKSSVVITKRGKPVARLEPFEAEKPTRKLGQLQKMKIMGDVVHSDFADENSKNTVDTAVEALEVIESKKESIAVIVPYKTYRKKNKIDLGLLQNKKMKIHDDFKMTEEELIDL